MKQDPKPFWGGVAKEDFHFFLFDKQSNMPISIENIGYTSPNARYCMTRTNNKYFVFEYVVSGKGYLEIDGKTYLVGAGDVYCIQPGYDHTYYADPQDPYEKIWINFFSDFFVDVFKAFGISGTFVFKDCKCVHLFQELQRLSKTSSLSDEICYQICSVLFQIVCLMAESTQEKKRISDVARQTKEMLDNSLYSNITVEEIAEKLHFSKIQISREFYKYYGQTPYNYLLSMKIKMAEKLLLKSSFTVSMISDKLAFTDPHYFSRIFKKKTGVSPSEYRQSQKD